ncbi:MAG: ABC transporter ATP-binding protein [Hyphomicrobiaceae bacterium]
MNDVVIRAEKLSKIYRLYKNPTDRIRDAFGLLRGDGRYSEHVALDSIDIAIRKGEKVGIIGRNGAGKSTLLKLITKTIEPTSGVLDVQGATQALLQIGTGFHPEFTGRDNVVSYLAQLGISGDKALKLTRDIIEFAEVEEYIDQPVKTYSTGMAARLMFAASTVIEPDVLVIDEVLGVGDAYFARKSYERIKTLCAENHATLLLVSHDIYSTAQICDRMIWIDRGRVKFDGEPKAAINLYESSIKEQEEIRLRRKAALAPMVPGLDHAVSLLVDIKSADGKPMTGVLFFYEAHLADGQETLARVDPTTGKSNLETAAVSGNALSLVYEGSNWLTTEEAGRSDGIILANYGQSYHKGTLRIALRPGLAAPNLRMAIESATNQTVTATIYDERQVGYAGGEITLSQGRRTDWAVPLDTTKLTRVSDLADSGKETRHGSGAVRITGVDILDCTGKSVRTLHTGQPACFHIAFKVNDATRAGDVEMMVALFKDGVVDAMHLFQSGFDIAIAGGLGSVHIAIDDLPLGPGRYAASLLIAKSGYYATTDGRPFSVHPDVFDVLSRSLSFDVTSGEAAHQGTVSVYAGTWRVSTDATGTKDAKAHV